MNRLVCIILIFVIFSIGCGKKSPPTLKPYEPPPVVKDFSAVRFEDSVILSWNYHPKDRERLDGFVILKTHNEETVNIKVPAQTSEFKDKNIKDKETYTYIIYGINKKGVAGILSKAIPIKICPMPQEKITPSYGVYDDYIEISWNAPVFRNDDADCNLDISYNIYKSYSQNSTSTTPLNSKPIKTTFFRLETVDDDISYFHIRPLLEGKTIHIGKPSNTIAISSGDLIPSKPKILNYTSVENRIFITWKEATESWVKGYKVYKMQPDGTFKETAFVTTPIYTEQINGKTQSYRITAVGPKKEGLPSEIITIKVR